MNKTLKKLTLSAMFLALGLLLPFITGQIPSIGNMLLPMHIPVLLCGLICGWQYGFVVGLIVPLLRFVLFGAPIIYPIGIAMALELAAYGLLSGLLYRRLRFKPMVSLYLSLLGAMIGGRIVWGITRFIIGTLAQSAFTIKMFMAGALMNAIPGIIIQLILIPAILYALQRAKLTQDFIQK